MSRIKANAPELVPPLLDQFKPLSALWEGRNPAYPSEYSARWFVRKLHNELAMNRAMAMHRGRLMYHPERFKAVVEKAAIEQFANRGNTGTGN